MYPLHRRNQQRRPNSSCKPPNMGGVSFRWLRFVRLCRLAFFSPLLTYYWVLRRLPPLLPRLLPPTFGLLRPTLPRRPALLSPTLRPLDSGGHLLLPQHIDDMHLCML